MKNYNESVYQGEITGVTSNDFTVDYTVNVTVEEISPSRGEDDGSLTIEEIDIYSYDIYTSEGDEVNRNTLDHVTVKEIEDAVKEHAEYSFEF